MQIKRIEAHNFRSYDSFSLPINNLGLTLLTGKRNGNDDGLSNGVGKAQPYSEPVMTPEGIKKMADLKVGDYVYNRFGKPVKVTNIFEKGKLDVYEVALRDGRKIKVNDEHLFSYFAHTYVKGKSKWVLKTVPLRDIIDSGYRKENNQHKGSYIYKYSIPLPSAIEYPKKSLAYDPYTLGAFLGDGNLNREFAYLIVGDHKLPILSKIVGNNENIKKYHRTSEYNYKYEFVLNTPRAGRRGKEITIAHPRDFRLPNCANQLTEDKRIPDDIFEASIEQRLQLLRGLFDTDGCVQLRKNRSNTANVSISSVNLTMVKQIQRLLWSLGYGAIISSNDRRGKQHKSSKYVYKSIEYKIEVTGDLASIQKLFSLPYHLNKLRQAHERRKHTDRLPITNVEKLGYQEQMCCIMVDDSEHLYVSGDYFVSHNTSVVFALTYALYGETPDGSKGDDVIKDDVGKDTYCKVEFEHGNHNYVITRYRKNSKFKNKVIVKRDKKDVTLSTNKETDKLIVETLGFGLDTLLNSLVFSPERLNTFINSTDKNRKRILEELTNTNIYKQAQQLVKIDTKDNAESLSAEEKDYDRLIALKDSQNALESNYKANKANWDKRHQELEAQLKHYDNLAPVNTTDKKQRLSALQAQLKQSLSSIDRTNEQQLGSQLSQAQNNANSLSFKLNQTKQDLLKNITTYKKIKSGEQNTCELCGQVLGAEHRKQELGNLAIRVKDNIIDYKKTNAKYEQANAQVESLEKQKYQASIEVDRVVKANQTIQDKLNTINDQIRKLDNQEYEYQRQLDQKNYIVKSIQELEANPVTKPDTKIKDYTKELNESQQRMEQYKQRSKDLDKLAKVYSDKGVKATALSLVIPYLNKKLDKYLKILTQDTMTAYLSSTSKTKSGKVNEQISLNVESLVAGDSYQELSSGEKQRIGIALNLAFMNYLSDQICGINLCFFDEIFDHLDQSGIDGVINILKDLKHEISNIVVISHNDDLVYQDAFDTHIKVVKVDNTSKLEL